MSPDMDNQQSHIERSGDSEQAVPAIPSVSELLTTDQVAEALGVSTKTLANYRARGTGPKYVRVGGRVFYTRTAYATYWAALMDGAA
ncbi:helix-turn-helix domain-containing protein [Nocardioides panacisoli]|uniref:helix-turn-helix transcriptional regulator n=1 Tax=Nocardioides panacisoli TaxID=627624 RepID=UPI001C638F10|nr:helix-turn-helix domain-containing protein [Nocardioides panacisoli]QYJ03110.1 helix-turn-helix domain-containing protein [Nocardioides panacisoli]